MPWECLYVDVIGPYTLWGNNNTNNEFMCVIVVDNAMIMLEMKEIPTVVSV